jgi:hypothetical protein
LLTRAALFRNAGGSQKPGGPESRQNGVCRRQEESAMKSARYLPRLGVVCLLGLVLGCSRGASSGAAEQEKLEKEFAESMTNVVLDGSFTVNRQGETQVREEKYTIASVSKVGGDIWVFQARIQYGDHDVTLPVPVKLLWAGDTPVVSLTDANIPGLGTFTARVLFYRDSYAGFWQHGDVSGNQFGRIIRGGEAASDNDSQKPAQDTASPEKAQ